MESPHVATLTGGWVPDNEVKRMCLYCGAEATRHLGICKYCGVGVCDKCGNIQVSMGERFAAHDNCLRQQEGGFSMIKFVK